MKEEGFSLIDSALNELKIKRDKKYGGDVSYDNYEELVKDYKSSKLHPLDIKMVVAQEINDLLEIFRKNKKMLEALASKAYSQ